MHRSVASLVVEIKAQMPANPVVEQGPSGASRSRSPRSGASASSGWSRVGVAMGLSGGRSTRGRGRLGRVKTLMGHLLRDARVETGKGRRPEIRAEGRNALRATGRFL